METDGADQNEDSYEMRLCRANAQLRRENQDMRKRVGRLEILLSDMPDFVGEKKALLEALDQSCEREQEARERLKGEETETTCLEDALSDIKYIKGAQRKRRIRLRLVKRDVFRAECDLVDAQHALAQRDEILEKKNAEIVELVSLHENCAAHVDVTAARLGDATKALNETTCAGTRQGHLESESRDLKSKKRTPPVKTVKTKQRRYRVKDILVTACTFMVTLLIFLLIIMSLTPECSSVWEFLLGDVAERLLLLRSVHHIGPLEF